MSILLGVSGPGVDFFRNGMASPATVSPLHTRGGFISILVSITKLGCAYSFYRFLAALRHGAGTVPDLPSPLVGARGHQCTLQPRLRTRSQPSAWGLQDAAQLGEGHLPIWPPTRHAMQRSPPSWRAFMLLRLVSPERLCGLPLSASWIAGAWDLSRLPRRLWWRWGPH